jgi:hypothetical protein
MRLKGDYLRLLRKDLGEVGFFFWCVKNLKEDCGSFGGR